MRLKCKIVLTSWLVNKKNIRSVDELSIYIHDFLKNKRHTNINGFTVHKIDKSMRISFIEQCWIDTSPFVYILLDITYWGKSCHVNLFVLITSSNFNISLNREPENTYYWHMKMRKPNYLHLRWATGTLLVFTCIDTGPWNFSLLSKLHWLKGLKLQ